MDEFDEFDSRGAPIAMSVRDLHNLPEVVTKWMSESGRVLFVQLVRDFGHSAYEIEAYGLGCISAACSNSLYDSFSEIGIDDEIVSSAKWIAETHLDALEAVRVNNERRRALNLPPRTLPVQREIRVRRGDADACDEVDLNENDACDENCECGKCGLCVRESWDGGDSVSDDDAGFYRR